MDDFTKPNEPSQVNDDTNAPKIDDEEITSTDDEPSAKTPDIDEQMEQFGLQKETSEGIQSSEENPEINEK